MSTTKRQRRNEPAGAALDVRQCKDVIVHMLSFVHPLEQPRSARVCRVWYAAVQQAQCQTRTLVVQLQDGARGRWHRFFDRAPLHMDIVARWTTSLRSLTVINLSPNDRRKRVVERSREALTALAKSEHLTTLDLQRACMSDHTWPMSMFHAATRLTHLRLPTSDNYPGQGMDDTLLPWWMALASPLQFTSMIPLKCASPVLSALLPCWTAMEHLHVRDQSQSGRRPCMWLQQIAKCLPALKSLELDFGSTFKLVGQGVRTLLSSCTALVTVKLTEHSSEWPRTRWSWQRATSTVEFCIGGHTGIGMDAWMGDLLSASPPMQVLQLHFQAVGQQPWTHVGDALAGYAPRHVVVRGATIATLGYKDDATWPALVETLEFDLYANDHYDEIYAPFRALKHVTVHDERLFHPDHWGFGAYFIPDTAESLCIVSQVFPSDPSHKGLATIDQIQSALEKKTRLQRIELHGARPILTLDWHATDASRRRITWAPDALAESRGKANTIEWIHWNREVALLTGVVAAA
jgi:hypothetical protein